MKNFNKCLALCMLMAAVPFLLPAVLCAATEPYQDVKAIVGRLAGGYNGASPKGLDRAKASKAMKRFRFATLEGDGERATIGPDASGKHILICATNTSAASFALGRYIRDVQKGCISWCGQRIPDEWPIPETTFSVEPSAPVRFAYNYCTLSYTMAFWSEAEWREEIDRIALTGFNAALLLQGLPAVWRTVLRSLVDADGRRLFSDEAIGTVITDEAAQAWWHMGNMEGLGGPLSQQRIDADAKLGRWLYAEMMRLGIKPCLQSYVGFVPNNSDKTLAQAVDAQGVAFGNDPQYLVIDQGRWGGYERPDVLNPFSTAFDFLAEKWYAALKDVYRPDINGWTGYMGGDLFHEGGNSGKLTAEDLAATARKIQDSQTQHFGNGGRNHVTWMLQGWGGNPKQAVRNGLDPKRTIIQLLDSYLAKDNSLDNSYVNKTTGDTLPWMWSGIMNFGGKQGLFGGLRRLSHLPTIATCGTVFRGYGMLSEGLETNPAMYEFFTEHFTKAPFPEEDFHAWWRTYAQRRYGMASDKIVAALECMAQTVWSCSVESQTDCVEFAFCAYPSLNVKSVSRWGCKGDPYYAPEALLPAAQLYLECALAYPELLKEDTFRFDFIELFVQVIADRFRALHSLGGKPGAARTELLSLIDLVERLLASEPRYTLTWHEARTRRTAGESGVKGYRRMITTWTGDYDSAGSSGLRDYAYRSYSGLMKGYYKQRWEAYFSRLDGKMTQSEYETFLRELDQSVLTAELDTTPAGDLLQIGREILNLITKNAGK